MDNFLSLLNNIQVYIVLGLSVIVIILLLLVIVLLRSMNKLENRYRKFMRGVNNKNLEELIISYLDKVDEVKNESEQIKSIYSNIDERLKGCIQKVSIVRYRAFEDVGSDLSFSVALLDDKNDGVIMTGIFGRNESTTYAKPIDKGISRYDLSEEENLVLENAINNK